MTDPPRSGQPGRPRRRWRWCRRGLLGLFLGLGATFLYLTLIGIPEVLQRPFLRQMRARGIDVNIHRLRLDWHRGLVAETVILSGTNAPRGPELAFAEIAVRLQVSRLLRFNFRLGNLDLVGGRLAVSLEDTDGKAALFTADSITGELHWLPDDHLNINRLTARAFGTRLELAGGLTNASQLGTWVGGKRAADEPPDFEIWQANLERAARLAETLRFSEEPVLYLDVSGDAADLSTVTARLRFQAINANTPWGDLADLQAQGQLNEATGTNQVGASHVSIHFAGFDTPWIRIDEGLLQLSWAQALTNSVPTQVHWLLDLQRIHSPWGTSPGLQIALHAEPDTDPNTPLAGDIILTSDSLLGGFAQTETNRLTARVTLDPDSLLPSRAEWEFDAVHVTFPRGSARELRLTGQIAHLVDRPVTDTSDWAWWSWLEPFTLDWRAAVDELVIDETVSDRVEMTGRWRAPALELTDVRGELLGSALELRGSIDVDSHLIHAASRFNLSAPLLDRLFPAQADAWLQGLSWRQPPHVQATLDVVWPDWTWTPPDWREHLLPTLRLEGSLGGRQIVYRDLLIDELHSHLSFSNETWTVSDFTMQRPEGALQLSYTEDLQSREYHLKLRSGVDPHAFEPLLGLRHDLIIDLFLFRAPPQVEGELWGSWRYPDRLGARATIEASNFSVRDEDFDTFSANLTVTNGLIHATKVQARIGDEWVDVPNVGFDLASHWLRFTNATARLHPQRVGRAIGPKTSRNLSPYLFLQPPRAQVEGGLKVTDTRHADMRFELTGGPFHYWRFRVPEIRGGLHWLDETLVISNLHASFYQGTLDGTIHVDIPRNQDSHVRFHTLVNRADFNRLVSDLFLPTNRLEGILNLNLTITDAIARDSQTWQGFGRADLRDGFLWDIPIFGLVSPFLDSVVPGLGRSRINGATATFSVTNSIVHTSDLELRAPFFRLAYRGAVDLNGRVNARVEARLLRDAWVVGPLVSLIFSPLTKLFEYQVGGTLARPEMELLYIPKPLQLPLDPVGTIRHMIEDDRPPPPPL